MPGQLLSLLPWAATAGALAALNPCGFALLPAYLSYYVGGTADGGGRSGVLVGLAMTAGVLAVFVILGGVISAVGTGLARVLPLANLAIGAVVAGVGAALLVRPGWTLGVSVGNPVAARPHLVAGRTIRAFTLFGAAYGVASLGCTLPIFLVVMAQALAAGGWLPGVGVFAAYGLGMGSVLVALSVAAGAGRAVLVGRARQVGRYLRPAGAVGMVAAGGYLIYYQLVVGRALMGVP